MPKQGEMTFLGKIGEEGLRHAVGKPFTDVDCFYSLAEISTILRLLPRPPRRLLDMGCGTGWTSVWYARCGYDVVGVDISAEMIHEAEKLGQKEGLNNLRFLIRDYESLNIHEEFDCAVFYHSLHHAEDEAAAIQSVYNALKPGGVCITCEPGDGHAQAESSLKAVEAFGTTEKDMPPRHIIQIARQKGFAACYAFPLVTANVLVEYTWSYQPRPTEPEAEPGTLPTPLPHPPKKSFLRKVMDRIIRNRLRVKRDEFEHLQHLTRKMRQFQEQGHGFTVLVK